MKTITTASSLALLFCLLSLPQLTASSLSDSLQIQQLLERIEQPSPQSSASEKMQVCQSVIVLAEQSGNKIWQANSYRTVGYFYEENKNLVQAEYYYQKAIQIAHELPYRLQLSIFIDWAIINKKLNRYTIAFDYYNKVKTIADQQRDSVMLGHAFNGLGTLHELLGEYNLAIDNYLKAVECAEKTNNNNAAVITHINIATVFNKGKNYDLSHKHIEKGYNLAKKLNDSMRIGLIYDIWGKTYATERNLQKAIEYYQKALSIFEKQNIQEFRGRTLLRIAEAFLQQNDWATAKKYLTQCSGIKAHLNFYDQPILYLRQGKLYEQSKDFDQAIAAYKTGFELAKERNLKDLIQESCIALSKAYQKTAQWQSAIFYLNIANAYRDSIFNDNQARLLAEAQYKFDVEKAESKFQFEKELDAKRIEEIKKEQRLYLLTALVVFILGILAFILYLNKVLRQKNREIQFQNERLEKSNEILRQFAYASAHDLKEPVRSIGSFLSIIKRRYAKLLPQEAEEYLQFMNIGVKRLETLLYAMLDYTTLVSENEKTENKIPLNDIFNDIQKELNTIIQTKQAVIDIPDNLPAINITYQHSKQLFMSLISNALKFSEKQPHIKIKSTILNNNFIISIEDNGIGIKKEYSDKIFRLFQKLNRESHHENAGIGLSVSQYIIERYGGTIWFDSDEGLGTTFYISFPVNIVCFRNSSKLVMIN